MERGHNDRGKVLNLPSPKERALGGRCYDLEVPGITAKCVEDLYSSVGVSPYFFDRLAPPEKIKIEKFNSALQYGDYDMQCRK